MQGLVKKTAGTIIASAVAISAHAATITIYDNFAVVQDKLSLSLQSGANDITHYDITRQLEPSSVMLTPTDSAWQITISEQNYLGTPIDQARLLEQFEGEEISFQVKFNDHETIKKGTILRAGKPNTAHTAAQDVIVEMEGQLQFGLPGKPIFPPLADHRLLKPQLSWKLNANKAGNTEAQLSYLTSGFGWNAAYNFVQTSDKTLDGAGWLTITNHSGKDFDKTTLKLVAGEVNKVQPSDRFQPQRSAMLMESASDVIEKAVDEFHQYTVPGKLNVRSGETKQVQFLSGSNIKYHTEYVYDGANIPTYYDHNYARTNREFGTRGNDDVVIYKIIENTARNGLGKPFPKGIIRFYEKDGDGLVFIGENQIDHTPSDEILRVNTGNAFDLKGERKQMAFSVNNTSRTVHESIEITLTNRKPAQATFKVVEHLYRGLDYELDNQEMWVKEDASTMYQSVDVPANSEKTVRYNVTYRW